MRKFGVKVKAFLSHTSDANLSKFFAGIQKNSKQAPQIIFMTPEKISKNHIIIEGLKKLYDLDLLKNIVIDEAHCVSQWGHEFREDYLLLGNLKKMFPSLPLLALTATATEAVKNDVINLLQMNEKTLFFKSSFNRPNLFYEIKEKKSKKQSIQDLFRMIQFRFASDSGIIYCLRIKDTTLIAEYLKNRGLSARTYHSKMSLSKRHQVHLDWLEGSVKIVVATIAFGMGIDKPDVRFVVHFSFSKV